MSSEETNTAEIFDVLSGVDNENYNNYKKKAFEAFEKKKYFTCLVAIKDAQSFFNDNIDLVYLQGVCHALIEDADKAIEYYEKALKMNQNHSYTLMNIIEINYFDERYEEVVKYINKVNTIVENYNQPPLPLLDFKLITSLSKLSETDPEKYKDEMNKVIKKYTYMDDNPFHYYSNALKLYVAGDKQEARAWIMKAYRIFQKNGFLKNWNKALIDTGYLDTHELKFAHGSMFKRPKAK